MVAGGRSEKAIDESVRFGRALSRLGNPYCFLSIAQQESAAKPAVKIGQIEHV